MKISRKRYRELGLEICVADCECCCVYCEKNGKPHCEEMPDNILEYNWLENLEV